MPRITLFGFYNYDPTLFDGIQLPAGMDLQTMKDTIIMECGDLYTYYQHPGYLKLNINSWFRRMKPQFERAYRAITVEYEPNENYDRYEDWEDSGSDSRTDSRTAANENETKTESEASGSREDKVSAFDSATYTPKAYTESGNKDESTTTGSASTEESGSSSGTTSGKHKGHMHGNIGTTTNGTMITEELRLRQYDLYLDIARQFQKRFIVEVY